MIELVNTAPVTVPVGQSIPFSIVATKGGCAERHRAGSAQVTLAKLVDIWLHFPAMLRYPPEKQQEKWHWESPEMGKFSAGRSCEPLRQP